MSSFLRSSENFLASSLVGGRTTQVRSVLLEINNASLSPDGYRGDVTDNVKAILNACKKHNHPVVLSSDSHGLANIGNFQYALDAIKTNHFPESLVLNSSKELFHTFLQNK